MSRHGKTRTITLLLSFVCSLLLLASLPGASFGEEKAEAPPAESASWLKDFNSAFAELLFFDISQGAIEVEEVDVHGQAVLDEQGNVKQKQIAIPFLLAFLLAGSIFFTFWFGFINVRGLRHSINVIRGKFDREQDKGEISHFRALTSSLSATVGLGNIAGVALAIQLGGPGAVFWMLFTAVFSMTAKFSSCTLAQMYRKENEDGSISGGPMYYLDIGLKHIGLGPFGKILGFTYATLVMMASIGGGNMFQANQTTAAVLSTLSLPKSYSLTVGAVMAAFVALVILGGIKRIGLATSRIVPLMCGVYVLASLVVILGNASKIPEAIGLIFTMAFTNNAFFGGLVGVLVMGVRRAAFSNEGGLGSAAIAHAAAKTDEPVREGIVGMIGPVIDTMIVCMMTALVVIITGVWDNPEVLQGAADLDNTKKGVLLTSAAFATVIPWFPYVLTVCVSLFAYSTMISWCYYGERGWIYIFDHFGNSGLKTVVIFRLLFVGFVIVGATETLNNVLDFSDLMILSLAFPNIIGSVLLAPKVKELLTDYWTRYKSGAMHPERD